MPEPPLISCISSDAGPISTPTNFGRLRLRLRLRQPCEQENKQQDPKSLSSEEEEEVEEAEERGLFEEGMVMVGEREDLSQAVNSAAADQESGHIELINKVSGGLL